jgi:hypothetical protein
MSLASPIQNPINLNQYPADEQGARCVKIILSGPSNGFTINDDLTVENENGTITNVQSVFIDNSNNVGVFTLNMLETGQVISVPGLSQGYFNILCHQQVSYTAVYIGFGSAAGIANVNIFFYNTPCNPSVWQSGVNILGAFVNTVNALTTANLSPLSSNQRAFLNSITVTSSGATAATVVTLSIANLIVNHSYNFFVPVLGTGVGFFNLTFPQPLPCRTLGFPITATLPANGAGNTSQNIQLTGFCR